MKSSFNLFISEHVLEDHTELVNVLAFSLTGSHLASGSQDGSLVIWEPITGVTKYHIVCPSAVLSLIWDPQYLNCLFVGCNHGVLAVLDNFKVCVTYTVTHCNVIRLWDRLMNYACPSLLVWRCLLRPCSTPDLIWSLRLHRSTIAQLRCHAPNRFDTVNMEDNVYIKRSWCEGWVWWNLVIAIYRTRRLFWCKRWLPTSSSHHLHKNRQEAEETEGLTTILVWEWNAHICSPTPIPEWAKKLKNWWRNKGEREETIFSAQMSFLGAQCQHSDILNSSVVSEAIKHMTILSESLECGLSPVKFRHKFVHFPRRYSPRNPDVHLIGHYGVRIFSGSFLHYCCRSPLCPALRTASPWVPVHCLAHIFPACSLSPPCSRSAHSPRQSCVKDVLWSS